MNTILTHIKRILQISISFPFKIQTINNTRKNHKERGILTNTYSNHMTGNQYLLKLVTGYDGGAICFRDNSKRIVIGFEIITFNESCYITNIYLVKGLKFNY